MEDISGKEVNLFMKALLKKIKELKKEKSAHSTNNVVRLKKEVNGFISQGDNTAENSVLLRRKGRKERLGS